MAPFSCSIYKKREGHSSRFCCRGGDSSSLCFQFVQNRADVVADTNRLHGDLLGTVGFAVIQTGIDRLVVRERHLPERILDDDGGVILIEHRFACFLCRAIVILLYTAVSDRDIVTGFAADVTDESVINIDLHNDLAVLLFLFMDHDAINQRMQQFFG